MIRSFLLLSKHVFVKTYVIVKTFDNNKCTRSFRGSTVVFSLFYHPLQVLHFVRFWKYFVWDCFSTQSFRIRGPFHSWTPVSYLNREKNCKKVDFFSQSTFFQNWHILVIDDEKAPPRVLTFLPRVPEMRTALAID